jgi:hypothetical protein
MKFQMLQRNLRCSLESSVTRGVVGDSLLPLLSGNTVGLAGVGGSNTGADTVSDEKLKSWRLEKNSRSPTSSPAISFICKTIS